MKTTVKKFIILIITLMSGLYAIPCMNEYEVMDGIKKPVINGDEISAVVIDKIALTEYIHSTMNCPWDGSRIDKNCTNVAVADIYLGKHESAVKKLEILIKQYSFEYNVVITYAVALELTEKYKEALMYLKKAIKLNPDSHEGSEWIHVKILEYVVKNGTKAPSSSILGIDFGNDSIPVAPMDIKIEKLKTELQFQLQDRLFFVEGKKDPVYGSLLFDYANCLVLMDHLSASVEFFQMAKDYGFESPVLDKRLKRYSDWKEKNNPEKHTEMKVEGKDEGPGEKKIEKKEDRPEKFNTTSILFISLSGMAFLLFVFLFIRSQKRKKSKK